MSTFFVHPLMFLRRVTTISIVLLSWFRLPGARQR